MGIRFHEENSWRRHGIQTDGKAAWTLLVLLCSLVVLLSTWTYASSQETLQVSIPVSGTGTFQLVQDGSVVKSETFDGSGNFTLEYPTAGNYEYTLKSTDAWNETEYLVTVIVHLDQASAGKLDADLIIQNTTTSEKSETAYFPLVEEDPPVAKRVAGEGAPETASFTVDFAAVSTTSGLSSLPMPGGCESQTLSVMLHGGEEKELGVLVFDRAGEYVYEVREAAGIENGFTYDDTVYRVVYQVTKDKTGFYCVKNYYKDDAEVELLRFEFVNRYTGSKETTPTPGAETTPTPGTEMTPTPGAETTPTPGAETTPTPGAETTPAPRTETTPAPGAETTPTPEAETTSAPGADGTDGGSSTDAHTSGTNSPQTGDTTNLLLWVIMLMASAGSVFGLRKIQRRS